jgi:hypothetical protein
VILLLALLAIALFVAVLVAKQNAERDAALRVEIERAWLASNDAPGITPSAAQPKVKPWGQR